MLKRQFRSTKPKVGRIPLIQRSGLDALSPALFLSANRTTNAPRQQPRQRFVCSRTGFEGMSSMHRCCPSSLPRRTLIAAVAAQENGRWPQAGRPGSSRGNSARNRNFGSLKRRRGSSVCLATGGDISNCPWTTTIKLWTQQVKGTTPPGSQSDRLLRRSPHSSYRPCESLGPRRSRDCG